MRLSTVVGMIANSVPYPTLVLKRLCAREGNAARSVLGRVEVCDALELDEDCDGEANKDCECIPAAPGVPAAVSTCAAVYAANVPAPVGVCATRSITCMASGRWASFLSACAAQTSEVCDAGRLDENCDGAVNENCTCDEGDTTTCAAQYPTSQGSCSTRSLTCTVAGSWPPQQGKVACAGCCNGTGPTGTCVTNGATNPAACDTAGEACTVGCPRPSAGTGTALCNAGDCGISCALGTAVNGTCCDGCRIAGVCRAVDGLNPTNSCQLCDPGSDPVGWTNLTGVICTDNLMCTTGDMCVEGQCLANQVPCTTELLLQLTGEHLLGAVERDRRHVVAVRQ